MRLSGGLWLFTACTLLRFIFSQPTVLKTLITRRTEFNSKPGESEKTRDVLTEKTHSFKSDNEQTRVRTRFGSNLPQSRSTSRMGLTTESPDLNSYLNLLSGFYQMSQPVPMDGFFRALVCLLANGTQCGWQADLTAALISKSSGPLMSFLTSVKSQMCPSNTFQRSGDPTGAQSQLSALHKLLSTVFSLQLSENFWTAWNVFFDLSLSPLISDMSCVLIDFLQLLVELVTIGLQFGIEAPTLNQTQHCPQGDLKQLIIWGMSQNLSWSFGDSILNMFLTPDVPSCSYSDPACQIAFDLQSSRSVASPVDDPVTRLSCDEQDVKHLNNTLCAEIISSRSQVPDALYYVCESLSTLSHSELTQVWRNTCHMMEVILSPLLEPCPPAPSESSQRVARSTLSLSQLFCNYENWTSGDIIDPGLVTICSDNEPEAFLEGVCNNPYVMPVLIKNPSNSWVWEYCGNVSERYMVWQYCVYDQWFAQIIDASIVAICWNNDHARMEKLLCDSLDFYMLIYSNQENSWIMPNCTEVPSPPPNDTNSLVPEMCRYSEWRNVMAVFTDQITMCIQNDEPQFVSEVCANTSFLTSLVLNKQNEWVQKYCTLQLESSPTVPPVASSTTVSPATPLISITSSSVTSTKTSTEATPSSTTLSPSLVPTTSSTFTTLSSTTLSPSLVPTTPSTFTALSPTTPLTFTSTLSSRVNLSPSIVPPVSSSIASSPSSSPNAILSSTSSFPILLTQSPPASTKIATTSNLMLSSSLTKLPATVSSTISTATLLPIISPTLSASVLSTISPTSLLPSTPPTIHPTIPSMSDLCKYSSWMVLPVHPSVIGLCWKFDMIAFHLNICCNKTLLARLIVDPQNQWLKSVCSDNDTSDFLPKICLYSQWTKPVVVDMTDLALCADLDTANFIHKVCTNVTVLQNLLTNLDNTWLLEQCSNLTGSGKDNLMGFKPSEQCRYTNWTVNLPNAALLALCWDYDQANFILSVCVKPDVLSHIVQDPSNLWVSALCATCLNNTRVAQSNNTDSSSSSSSNTNTTELHLCLVKEMIVRLNWTCSIDLNTICQPDIPQLQAFQAFLRCGVEVLLPRLEKTMTAEVASMVRQAQNLWVILLLVLEENGMTTLRVTDNIGQSVLDSVSAFLEKETSFSKKQVLLQCFAKVLTSLMQTGRDVTSDGSFLIKQYFAIPLERLRAVLSSVDMNTMRLILHYLNRNHENLQLTEDYLRTLVSVLIQIHLRQDETLFLDLGPLLRFAKPEDIISLPPLQSNPIVLNLINNTISSLSADQRQAFGSWFGQSLGTVNITAGDTSFIRDCGNLIAYLPFRSFQHLSPAQVLNGLDVLLRNELGDVKQQFVAQSVFGVYKNLTADDFRRLATLTCQASMSDLLAYVDTSAFPVIQENIRTCVAQGTHVPSNMISSLLFVNGSELQSPGSLSPQKVSQLVPLFPLLGAEFLQQLNQSQLVPVFSALTSVHFTPTQAAVIVDKISSSLNLFDAGTLPKLGSLLSGLRAESLSTLPSTLLLSTLTNFSQYKPQLTPPQINAITTHLWAAPAVVTWLDEAELLLSSTPLQSVMPQTQLILTNSTAPYTHSWNTQQAKTLFNEVMSGTSSLTTQHFLSLGTVAQGVSCNILTKLFQSSVSMSSMRDLLQVLRQQPVPLHPSLKRCLFEVMYKSDYFLKLLGEMGAEIALSIPMSSIKKFSPAMMDSLRRMILLDPQYFLLLPRIKQVMLVDKMVQSLGLNTAPYTEQEFRSLGIMATFVVDTVFLQLDRRFFVDSIEFLRGFCYNASKSDIVASMLQEDGTFGPVQKWNSTTLIQVDRFLFFLPQEIIQLIPPALMSPERIERLFFSQQQWEDGDVGSVCEHHPDKILSRKQFVFQYFSGLMKLGRSSPSASSAPPSCESVQATGPAVWSVINLVNMSSSDFRQCLELFGQEPSFTSDQLSLLLHKTKEVYGVVSSFTPSVVAQLGRIATQLSLDELASLKLSEILSIAPLGAVSTWTRKQLGVLFSTVLNVTKQTPLQLNSSSLVALGHMVCGIEASVIQTLNPVEFSKAVLWLGRLNLSCSEDQLQAVVFLLSSRLVFGPISTWGPEVFLEIGAFSAGIPDMAMSALVKEQIEGITPLAISLITAKKFAVVFNQAQISVFSYEQAAAVTTAQRSALSSVQQTALSIVLNSLEDKPVDFRGRSSGVAAEVCLFCHVCSLLVFVLMLLLDSRT
ncbi:hypothetical protein KOW79_021144 [Hemibagrus wyckioides]|uniref:Stereocilin LRR domain-containing protein n=1 Tax=Hemibagrus wyckioides TaxID=337641 RepID=A0A9D3N1Y9_9TELE|nr:stereocilin [Hemibagrus wyckioides]KAG7315056.1 hypothetical protein KOW79_021144 [Hemibagrus wyckioides]